MILQILDSQFKGFSQNGHAVSRFSFYYLIRLPPCPEFLPILAGLHTL